MIELLKELAIKSFENAEELYEESRILLDAEKYSRSLFLTQIAGEELGKHIICSGAIVNFIVGKFDIKRFKNRFYKHMEKTQTIDTFEKAILGIKSLRKPDIIKENAKILEETKLMGLYCGFIDKYVFKPSEVIEKSLAEGAIDILNKRLKLIKSLGLVHLLKSSNHIPPDKIKNIYNKYVNKSDL